MGDIVYLRIIGEKQGDISSGCGTYASVGNRWQVGHEDEIFLPLHSPTPLPVLVKALICRGYNFANSLIKSSPLLSNAINQNERLFIEIDLYRINKKRALGTVLLYSAKKCFINCYSCKHF
ncbi:type VI secretion system tube protein TssD [Escherichia coli]